MFEYMRDGGWNMWLMLMIACATTGYAFSRQSHHRRGIFLTGCLAVLTSGILGMSSGMIMVTKNVPKEATQHAMTMLLEGLRELSNNGTFAATLIILLGVGALLFKPAQTETTSPLQKS
jgi:hypothetical protein